MLSPIDIHNKQFSRSWLRGYKESDVDDFLDRIVNDYELLIRENSRLKKDIDFNNKQLDQYSQLEKNLQDTLLIAQRTADEVQNTANARAEEIRESAKKEAQNLVKEAEINAKNLVKEAESNANHMLNEAKAEAKRIVEEANDKIRFITDGYVYLVQDRKKFMAKMHNLLNTELEILTVAEKQVPSTDEIMQRGYDIQNLKNKVNAYNSNVSLSEEPANGKTEDNIVSEDIVDVQKVAEECVDYDSEGDDKQNEANNEHNDEQNNNIVSQ